MFGSGASSNAKVCTYCTYRKNGGARRTDADSDSTDLDLVLSGSFPESPRRVPGVLTTPVSKPRHPSSSTVKRSASSSQSHPSLYHLPLGEICSSDAMRTYLPLLGLFPAGQDISPAWRAFASRGLELSRSGESKGVGLSDPTGMPVHLRVLFAAFLSRPLFAPLIPPPRLNLQRMSAI